MVAKCHFLTMQSNSSFWAPLYQHRGWPSAKPFEAYQLGINSMRTLDRSGSGSVYLLVKEKFNPAGLGPEG